MNKNLIVICAVLVLACAGMVKTIGDLQSDKSRLAANQAALMADVEFYQTEAGKAVASVQALQLTKSELERNCTSLTHTIDELNIKLKRVQAASTAATQTVVKVETVVKDTVVLRDTTYIKVDAFQWCDPWVSVNGLIYPDDKLDLDITSTDTLVQVVHRVPKKWWFFKWGTKAIRQEIVSTNPHTKIIYSEYIELTK